MAIDETFEENLKKWILYFETTRQVGHTYTAMNGVKNNHKALLVCAHQLHAKQIGNQGISINTSMIGKKNPVVFDNYTIYEILVKSLTERIDKQKVSDAINKLKYVVGGNSTTEVVNVGSLKKELGRWN